MPQKNGLEYWQTLWLTDFRRTISAETGLMKGKSVALVGL